MVRAAAQRRSGTGSPHREAYDRDLRIVCARRASRLFRARYCSAPRDEAVLFRAHPQLYRPPARPLPTTGGDRSGLVETARPLLAPYLDFRPSEGPGYVPAGRLCRLCTPPGFVRRPARRRDPAENGAELGSSRLHADGAMQRMGHEQEALFLRLVTFGLPDFQFLRRQLWQNVVLAVAPDRSARAVERHYCRKADEVDQTGVAHSPVEAAVGNAARSDRMRRHCHFA